MNRILEWLSGGDLRSDGPATQISELVLKNPELIDDLLEGLRVPDEVIRGRTADALEKIARTRPDLLIKHIPEFNDLSIKDPVPMVKWHLAMLLGHMAIYPQEEKAITSTLIEMLADNSVFVRSWAVVSLCIYGRVYPIECERIINAIHPLQMDPSIAIRSRVRKALSVLTNPKAPFPKGWIKSEHLQDI